MRGTPGLFLECGESSPGTIRTPYPSDVCLLLKRYLIDSQARIEDDNCKVLMT